MQEKNSKIEFIFPFDGDCINIYDGIKNGDFINIEVLIRAESNHIIYVNGEKCVYKNGIYSARIDVKSYRNEIVAKDITADVIKIIIVYRLKIEGNSFRLSCDDNIFFLDDINKNKETYKSIFDNEYLAMYKRLHTKTGVKVNLNLFYDNSTSEGFKKAFSYFDLSMMTDKYKSEWEENSNWLQLSFHSAGEFPVAPYKHKLKKVVTIDAEKVNNEIIRFAGESTLSNFTTVHYGAVSKNGVKGLLSIGYKGLLGYFEFENKKPIISYFYSSKLVKHISSRNFWIDNSINMIYKKIDIILNLKKSVEENIGILNKILIDDKKKQCIELMIHEQYYYEDYENYMNNYEDILYNVCKLLKDKGYVGIQYKDIIE